MILTEPVYRRMAFSLSSRNISLDKARVLLYAECRTSDGTWKFSYLNLSKHLSCNGTKLSFLEGQSGFEDHAVEIFLQGAILNVKHTPLSVREMTSGVMPTFEGISMEKVTSWTLRLNLDLCVKNDEGNLKFVP